MPKFRHAVAAAALACGTCLPAAAQAAVTVTIAQVGTDVVATSSGTLNLTGLTFYTQYYGA